MNTPSVIRRSASGFSLIELAIVLVIIGLLIGGGIVALERTTERERRQSQQRQLEEVKSALMGFAMVQGRLPCPDTSSPPNGREGEGAEPDDSCQDETDPVRGVLPWADLGVGARDSWGDRILYALTPEYADLDQGIGTAGDIEVLDANETDENGEPLDLASDVPAVVVSFGGQGQQVWSGGLPCVGLDGFSDQEIENCGGDAGRYFAGSYRGSDAPDGRFDDMVIWISDGVYKMRMFEAGNFR